jgi:hypothetical protein
VRPHTQTHPQQQPTNQNQKQPRDIPAARMGVGACLWEGELLLAAYLAAQPRHRYIGQRCVELGSGPGLAGLLLAALGARVAITDKASVLPLIRENIELNGLSDGSSSGGSGLGGSARAEELEWGSEGCAAAVTALSAPPGANDWVLAADVTYVDGDGASPDTAAFVEAARGACLFLRLVSGFVLEPFVHKPFKPDLSMLCASCFSIKHNQHRPVRARNDRLGVVRAAQLRGQGGVFSGGRAAVFARRARTAHRAPRRVARGPHRAVPAAAVMWGGCFVVAPHTLV